MVRSHRHVSELNKRNGPRKIQQDIRFVLRDNMSLDGSWNHIRLQDSIIGCCEIKFFANNLN